MVVSLWSEDKWKCCLLPDLEIAVSVVTEYLWQTSQLSYKKVGLGFSNQLY